MLAYLMNQYPLPKFSSLIVGLLLTFCSLTLCAKEPNWQAYEQILDKYVTSVSYQGGTLHQVNYSGLQNDQLFDEVIQLIASYPVKNLSNREERLAFYINAYNILAIKQIIDNWPVKSIKQVGSLFTQVWDKPAGLVSGQTFTLRNLEDRVIRKYKEPRIHFAINCAAVSCPNLRKEPYTAKKLNQQLDEQTRTFLNDPYKGAKRGRSRVHVSKIFKWFANDFKPAGGTANFIYQYRPEFKGSSIRANIKYNWGVNGD